MTTATTTQLAESITGPADAIHSAGVPANRPQYPNPFTDSLLAMIERISVALGFTDQEMSTANGDEEIQERLASWRAALEFYAGRSHFALADDEETWDTVSGEPSNFWCDEAGTATVEDGTVAAMALAGTPLPDEGDDAPVIAKEQGNV